MRAKKGMAFKKTLNKKGSELGWNELAKWLIAIVVLVVILGIFLLSKTKSQTLFGGLKNLFISG